LSGNRMPFSYLQALFASLKDSYAAKYCVGK